LTQTEKASPAYPALWHDPPPDHWDMRMSWWFKILLVAAATIAAICFLDRPVALWTRQHPIADLANPELIRTYSQEVRTRNRYTYSDLGRELMFAEQYGQFICSWLALSAVFWLDPAGRRRSLAIALGCIITALSTQILKDIFGRSRPFNEGVAGYALGLWEWRSVGFGHGSQWGSFPSAHTTSAFALSAGLAWFYPRGRLFFMLMALTTAVLRVLHSAHYVSDVIAGMGIGVFLMRLSLHARLAGRMLVFAPAWGRRWWFPDIK
jgi:membrane-associated phospholipid phosphatase